MACRWHGVVSSSVSSSESKASRKQAHATMHESQRGQRYEDALRASAQSHVAAMTPDRERTVWGRGVVSWWSHKHKRDG